MHVTRNQGKISADLANADLLVLNSKRDSRSGLETRHGVTWYILQHENAGSPAYFIFCGRYGNKAGVLVLRDKQFGQKTCVNFIGRSRSMRVLRAG
ncbi:uncharacterized [Tachysurus ichikawai]